MSGMDARSEQEESIFGSSITRKERERGSCSRACVCCGHSERHREQTISVGTK